MLLQLQSGLVHDEQFIVFYSLVVIVRELYGMKSFFLPSFIWNGKQPVTIEEASSVIKNGWFVLGNIRVVSFAIGLSFFFETVVPINRSTKEKHYHEVNHI